MNKNYLFILPVVAVFFIISTVFISDTNSEIDNVDTISVFQLQSLASALTSLQGFLTSDTTAAIEPLGCELNTDKESVVKGERFKLSWTTTGAKRVVLSNNQGYKKNGLRVNRKSFRVGTNKQSIGTVRYTLRAFDSDGNKKVCRQKIDIKTKDGVVAPSVASLVSSQTTKLSWNTPGKGYQYALDIKPKGKAWIGPCVDAGVLSGTSAYTYKGTCPSASNKKIAKKDVEKFRLYYTKGQWDAGATREVTINNDLTKDKLRFDLMNRSSKSLQNCSFASSTVQSRESVTAFKASSVPAGSTCISQKRSCTDGTLSRSYLNELCVIEELKEDKYIIVGLGQSNMGRYFSAYKGKAASYLENKMEEKLKLKKDSVEFIKYAVGGTALDSGNKTNNGCKYWVDTGSSSFQDGPCLTKAFNGIESLVAQGKVPDLFLWSQGEADVNKGGIQTEADIAQYKKALKYVFKRLRTAAGDQTVQVGIQAIGLDNNQTESIAITNIRKIQYTLSSAEGNHIRVVAKTDDLGEYLLKDGSSHFSLEGQKLIIDRIIESLKKWSSGNLKKSCQYQNSVISNGESFTKYTSSIAPEGGTCADLKQKLTCSGGSFGVNAQKLYASCTENKVISSEKRRLGSKGADTSIVTLKDGTMLMLQSISARVEKAGELLTYKIFTLESKDNGQTWKDKSVAVQYKETTTLGYGHKVAKKVWGATNPFIMESKSGRLYASFKLKKYKKSGNSSNHIIEMIYSDDKGSTWKPLSTVYSRRTLDTSTEKGGMWEPYIFEPSNRPDVLQVYFARERPQRESCPGLAGKGQDIVMSESVDGGKTWSEPTITLRRGRSREGMPSVIELPGGRLALGHEHARYPSCFGGKAQKGFVPAVAISDDGGKTWKDETVYMPKSDMVASGWFFMKKLIDGRLAMRFSRDAKPGSNDGYSQLLLTKNIPTSNNLPLWQKNPIQSMNGFIQWGTIGQAKNGDIIVTGVSDAYKKQMYNVIQYTSLPKPPVITTLTWNILGAKYQYSLDAKQKGKDWVGPCVGASILGQSSSYTFDGSCTSSKKEVDKNIPTKTVDKFRLCYTKGQWGDGTAKCNVINNVHTKETQNFKLSIPRAEKPNILFIMLDDAGYDDYTNVSSDIIKPNMDRFASESTRFEQFYTNPMCTPTRMTLLSGNYAMKYGISWVCGSNAVYGIPSSHVTLPEDLSSFGYKTSTFGKWHSGKGRRQYEVLSKFEYSAITESPVKNGYFNPVYFINGIKQDPLKGTNLIKQTASYVIDQIQDQSAADKPFFINYWLNAPHGPHEPSLKWVKNYIPEIKTGADYFKVDASGKLTKNILDKWEKKKHKPALYKALMSQADENIGRVLDVIDSDPYLKKNTIVVLVSDNGGTRDSHPDGNGPLRGFKTDVFEGGTRLPMFIRWPENTEPGVTDMSVVSAEDVYPTLMELAGGTVPVNIAGKSFAPIVLNEKSNVTRETPLFRAHKVKNEHLKDTDSLYDYDLMSYSVRDGKWKLVYEPLARKKAYLFDMSKCAAKASSGNSCEEDVDDVSNQNLKRFNKMKQMYRDWLFKNAKIPLNAKTFKGTAKKALTTNKYTFTGSGGAVKLKNRLDFDITRMDATFTARVTPKGRDGTARVIARREGSWILRINADNKLELQILGIVGKKNINNLIVGTRTLQTGKTYDVAFSLYAYKSRNTVAKIYSRDVKRGGRMILNIEAEVPPLKTNDNTMTLGAGKNDKINRFIGVIDSPKMLKAPLSRAQIEKFIGIDVATLSCFLDGTSVVSQKSDTFYNTRFVALPGSCASQKQVRTCTSGTLGGDVEYSYSGCSESAVVPGTTFGGPSIIELADGSLLTMRRNSGKLVDNKTQRLYTIDVLRSTDGAITWNPWSTFFSKKVPENKRLSHGNMHTIQLPEGRLLTAYREHIDYGTSVTDPEVWDRYVLKLKKSDDNGKTWQFLGIIDSKEGTGTKGTWVPVLIQPSQRPGVLQVYFADERDVKLTCGGLSGDAQDIVVKESLDGGKTWGDRRIALRRGSSREGVPAITELTDGSLLMAFETKKDNSCAKNARKGIEPGVAQSNDGGLTWQYLSSAYKYKEFNAKGGWPDLLTLKDGRVLLKFAPNEDNLDTLEYDPNNPDSPYPDTGGLRDIKLILSKNIPTYNNPPVWNEPVLGIKGARWGQIDQLQNGDVVIAGNDFGFRKTKIKIIPLSELNSLSGKVLGVGTSILEQGGLIANVISAAKEVMDTLKRLLR